MVTLNRAQLAALKKLISTIEIEQLVLSESIDEVVKVTLTDLNDNSMTLWIDEYGQGRVHGNGN